MPIVVLSFVFESPASRLGGPCQSSLLTMTQSCTPLKSPAHAAPLSNYTNPAVFASCICENASKADSKLILLAGDDRAVNDDGLCAVL